MDEAQASSAALGIFSDTRYGGRRYARRPRPSDWGPGLGSHTPGGSAVQAPIAPESSARTILCRVKGKAAITIRPATRNSATDCKGRNPAESLQCSTPYVVLE